MLHVSAHPPSLFMFYVETCRFSGCADKTTSEPGLSVCIGISGDGQNAGSAPSASSQQVNLSFLIQKGWGPLTSHPSLLPSLKFDDSLTALLLQRCGTSLKQKWQHLTDNRTDQEETYFLSNTITNLNVTDIISFFFLFFKLIWGTP